MVLEPVKLDDQPLVGEQRVRKNPATYALISGAGNPNCRATATNLSSNSERVGGRAGFNEREQPTRAGVARLALEQLGEV